MYIRERGDVITARDETSVKAERVCDVDHPLRHSVPRVFG